MTKMYRQGDLLFVSVDQIPKFAKERKSDVILEGEATGHCHRIQNGQILEAPVRRSVLSTILNTEMESAFEENLIPETFREFVSMSDSIMWISAERDARVIHEEHHTINLPSGCYIVIRQREYDEQKYRLVLD